MSRDVSAYLKTKVPFHRTKEKLYELLESKGITEVRITDSPLRVILEFNYPIQKTIHKLGVRFDIPLPEMKDEKKRKQTRDQYYRALYYILKSKLETVEFGIREFGREFLGDLIYHLPNGTSPTIADVFGPQIERGALEGKSEILMIVDMRGGDPVAKNKQIGAGQVDPER